MVPRGGGYGFVLGPAPPLLYLTGLAMWWTRVVRPKRGRAVSKEDRCALTPGQSHTTMGALEAPCDTDTR
jgi:hypothetical protein